MRDEPGYRALFEAEYPRLVRELRVIVADGALAEDLAADAFEQLLRRWSKVREYERPGAWVRLVALRGASKAQRRRARRPAIEASWAPRAGEPPVDLDLKAALAQLTLHQRAAVVLHHLGGYSGRDVASMLGCEEVTVRTHLLRGRRRLAELLDDTTVEEVSDVDH